MQVIQRASADEGNIGSRCCALLRNVIDGKKRLLEHSFALSLGRRWRQRPEKLKHDRARDRIPVRKQKCLLDVPRKLRSGRGLRRFGFRSRTGRHRREFQDLRDQGAKGDRGRVVV